MSEKQELMESIEKYRKEPDEFYRWLNKEPLTPEKEWEDLEHRIAPTCQYCSSIVDIRRRGNKPVFLCTEEDRELTKEEVVKPDVDEEVTRQVNDVARKVARLVLESTQESDEVYRHLIETEEQGDGSWSEMLEAVGRDTPEIAVEINDMEIPNFMLGWAVLSVKFLYEHHHELDLEG